jgi:hypothetical protein
MLEEINVGVRTATNGAEVVVDAKSLQRFKGGSVSTKLSGYHKIRDITNRET